MLSYATRAPENYVTWICNEVSHILNALEDISVNKILSLILITNSG